MILFFFLMCHEDEGNVIGPAGFSGGCQAKKKVAEEA